MELESVGHVRPASGVRHSTEFEAFVRNQRDGLLRFLRRRAPLEDTAQDLAQESLLRMLYRIAINGLNHRPRRADVRHDARHTGLDADVAELTSAEPAPEQQAATRQQLDVLQRALLGLPTRCRQIYLLHRIEGMSYGQIASRCNISVKAVEKHVSDALNQLRERMASFNQETDPS